MLKNYYNLYLKLFSFTYVCANKCALETAILGAFWLKINDWKRDKDETKNSIWQERYHDGCIT